MLNSANCLNFNSTDYHYETIMVHCGYDKKMISPKLIYQYQLNLSIIRSCKH